MHMKYGFTCKNDVRFWNGAKYLTIPYNKYFIHYPYKIMLLTMLNFKLLAWFGMVKAGKLISIVEDRLLPEINDTL